MRYLKVFESFKKDDTIILVGGGISNLYCAYKLKNKYPNIKLTILEKENYLGGRTKIDEVSGVKVPTGAYFVRIDKDKLVVKLLKELGIDLNPRKLKIDYSFENINGIQALKKLKSAEKDFDRSKLTFEEFGRKVLKDDFDEFVKVMGYTDYLKADYVDTLNNYGLEDNLPGYQISECDWGKVVEKLVQKIGKSNIKLNYEVKSIISKDNKWIINSELEADNVILGIPIKPLRRLLKMDIYNQIESQNFLKVFAKVDGLDDIEKYNVVDSPLRKVIPIGKKVINIAFADNKDARTLKLKDKDFFEKELKKEFNTQDIKISALKKFFWDEGTHYFEPLSKEWGSRIEFLKKCQNPKEGLYVVGECVAVRQGWVEGALSSVENIDLF